ncbi:MAG: alpha/beta hydrolase [Akkermansiaceae bacterium]
MKTFLSVLSASAFLALPSLSFAQAPAEAPKKDPAAQEKPANPLGDLLNDKDGSLSRLAETLLGKNGGNRLFYFPTKDQPFTPEKYGYKYEDVSFKSADGTKLHGWFLPSTKGTSKAKGTVVFSHGNAGSVAHHLGFVTWLLPEGYNVLLYDYRAFGKSEGAITRKGLIEDVRAAFTYVATRKDVDANRLISFAHSLGGAKSLAAIGMKPIKGLRAVISHGGFASYKQMAIQKAGQVGGNLTTDELSALQFVEKVSPLPLLIIHGTADAVVPVGQGEALFKKAKEPKTFFKVEGANHQNSLSKNNGEYRKKMLAWLDEKLKPAK